MQIRIVGRYSSGKVCLTECQRLAVTVGMRTCFKDVNAFHVSVYRLAFRHMVGD